MSPSPSPQPSRQQSASQREDDLSRMDIDDISLDNIRVLTAKELRQIPKEDRVDWSDKGSEDDDSEQVVPPPSSADPAQPLSGGPAMGAALDEISSAAPATRPKPAAMLKAMIEAQGQVDAAAKAEAEKAATMGRATASRPEKRSRPVSGSTPTDSSKKSKADHPVPDIDMTEAKPPRNRPTSFDHIYKPEKNRGCAVIIDDNEMMGNPFSPTPGWDLKVSLDPGKLGQPSMGFNFKFAKDGNDSRSKDNYDTFAVGWEPGVQIGGKWMMEGLHVERAAHPSHPDMLDTTFPPAIRKLCKKPEDAERLFCMAFRSNAHKSSPMDVNWAKNLHGDDWEAPFTNLQRMYGGDQDPSYNVYVWFVCPNRFVDRYYEGCLLPLVNAVKDHTPPFHQYLDENDEPMIDFNLPTIKDIGNGMYRRYPKTKDHMGRKVENRNATPTYLNLPKTVTWDSIKTFHITYGVPIVRGVQYDEGVHVRLENGWHGVFLQKLPVYKDEGKTLQPDSLMQGTYQAGIRMQRDPATGLKDAIPEVGSIVTIDFYNGDRSVGRGHETIKENICYGRVSSLGGRAFLEKTGCDFCVLVSKPRRSTQKLFSYPKARNVTDQGLLYAKLRVKVNLLPAKRDKAGFKKFCTPAYAPELLDPIRLAFWSDPSKTGRRTDLTKGPAHNRSNANKTRYREILDEMKGKRKINRTKTGPPGAGKTRTLRDKIIALTKIGHKVVCVASSNVAVDTDANAVWSGLSQEDRKVYKCLRLETDGAERAQRLTKVGYAHYTGAEGEEDKIPEYLGPKEAQDNPAIRNALDKLCVDFATRPEYVTRMFAEYEDVNKAYQAVQNFDEMRQSGVATGMTLDYRIWEITQVDKRKAEADYEEARNRLTPEEFNKQLVSGEISVAKFDKSTKYRECINNYISKQGYVTKQERTALEDETDAMISQVLAETHILFSTASNCGGPLLENSRSFVPTVIFCDEAGQISIPSLCVPLTTFDKWEGLFLFGDIQQLEPTVLSGQFNEFSANAKVSPLALLAIKGFPTLLLDTQYRMCPACSKFPRSQFYDDQGLKDSDVVLEDNEVRKAIRKITLDLGIKGDDKAGTEYVVTNVEHGCSRVELNGTSLVNYANADVVLKMIDRFIKSNVIKASMIKILTYYQGQPRLLLRKINDMPWTQAIKDAIEISTVDAFQGREARVVIVDTVAAKDKFDKLQAPMSREENAPEDAEDFGGEDYVKAGAVTGHVRSPNRLNVALTRGRDATIVVCQAALLASTTRSNRGKQSNAVANMIGDAKERNCWIDDPTEDSHPESVKIRADLGQKKIEMEREIQKRKDLDFIAEGRTKWQAMKVWSAIPPAEPFKLYRTHGGHTTRPIGNPELVAEADAFDEQKRIDDEQKQIEDAKEASLISLAVQTEDERTLQLGIKASQMDTGTDGGDQDEVGSVVSDEEPPSFEEEVQPRAVGEEYVGLDAGTAEDQFN